MSSLPALTIVYHVLKKDHAPSVLQKGLLYGEQGEASREPHAIKVNELLNEYVPPELKVKGIDRQRCLYAYLCLDGRILDLTNGQATPAADWRPPKGSAKLQLSISPGIAYLADLDAFDRIAARVAKGASRKVVVQLARAYWRRVLPLPVVLRYYATTGRGLTLKPDAPPNLPPRFGRVEILLTKSIPPSAITAK